jgi:polyhydroxyalkanoate synthesis regulator phasin
MRRVLASLAAALSLAGLLLAQSLGEVAEKEKQRRTGKPAKVYTNEDLPQSSASPKPSSAPVPAAARSAARPAADDSAARAREQAAWRGRAAAARADVARSEARVAQLERQLAELANPMRYRQQNPQDPYNVLTQDQERVGLQQQLEEARRAVDAAKKALENLEEEARRRGVPPGWLREP